MTAKDATHDLPEVCSPLPSKQLNFLGELPLSPFAAAASLGDTGAPWPRPLRSSHNDSQQQLAQRRDSSRMIGSGDLGSDEDWQEHEVLDDQENQHPGGCAAAAAPQAAATWLFSPVRRPDARSGTRAGTATPAGPARPTSAPRAIPSPLLSPSAAMSTPPKEALPAAAALPTADRHAASSLAHAPSFGSWLTSAVCRPPSPPPAPPAKPVADVADVVACISADCRAPRPFERGGPTPLDQLLAQLGDSHYPASGEAAGWARGDMLPPGMGGETAAFSHEGCRRCPACRCHQPGVPQTQAAPAWAREAC